MSTLLWLIGAWALGAFAMGAHARQDYGWASAEACGALVFLNEFLKALP